MFIIGFFIVEKYQSILRKYWGYSDFRPLQEDIIDAVCQGHDVLGLMPTGGGKSITFQVPALYMPGICIVVTPLIALMKDQVENLRMRNIMATAIYSGITSREIDIILDNCIYGDYKFLYVSPERLSTDCFLEKVKRMNVSLIVVDESHCISQWGYDFRPSYLRIAELRDLIPSAPVLALTATATPDVVLDIQKQLKFRNGKLFQKSFLRKNIAYIVRKTDDKLGMLMKILDSVQGTSIIYVRNRSRTKEIAEFLQTKGYTADYFHAGLTNEQKDLRQSAWKSGECRVIVATNAFGMGIDKPDVRTVIHIDIPDTLEAYFQEAGRAGRDEKLAYATLLYNKTDITKLKKRISDSFPSKDFVVSIYNKICYYYNIGVGEGEDFMKDFSLSLFCQQCKLPILQTFSALKILHQAGYLELTDEISSTSKVQFIVTSSQLFSPSSDLNGLPGLTELVDILLRSYTGIFTDLIPVDEDYLASRLDLTRDQLYSQLLLLSKLHLIKYIPGKKSPYLIFLQRRVDEKYIVISKGVYEERLARFEDKINKIIAYVSENDHCRSRMLLQYFGEMESAYCGICDFCRAKSYSGISNHVFYSYREKILSKLKDSPSSLSNLILEYIKDETVVKEIIRWMLDNGELVLIDDTMLTINKKV